MQLSCIHLLLGVSTSIFEVFAQVYWIDLFFFQNMKDVYVCVDI